MKKLLFIHCFRFALCNNTSFVEFKVINMYCMPTSYPVLGMIMLKNGITCQLAFVTLKFTEHIVFWEASIKLLRFHCCSY